MSQRTFRTQFVEQLFGAVQRHVVVLILVDELTETFFNSRFG